ncbi:membrane protein insertion efficiency factor YidD [Mycetocola zhujimingii]|uniref:membrane protein insertion efficiency factor YidD n=1 Tax=Mycetocola zhujimingii TaxID=2079792 RepID=UPI000D39ADA9|nr:membrane protein insertion efficiency factor YidD [Mycetocola zhujimingii]AWB87796.1 membrane protein insertion efficiency factor YidD [Mycetocola zhujimingii]
MTGVAVNESGVSGLAHGILLMPRNAAVAALIAYRTVISPLYGEVCRYYPSCSAYAMHAIQQHGVTVGSGLAALRIARCHPWAAGGVDDAPLKKNFRYSVTPRGFVVTAGHRKG